MANRSRNKSVVLGAVVGGLALLLAAQARADVVYTGSGVSGNTGNTVSAQATFSLLAGNVLQVILKNTTPGPESAIRRGDTLTGVIWDNTGTDPTLSGLTIALVSGSNIYTNATTINNATSLVGTWAFKGMPGGPYTYVNNAATFEYGISAIGGGVFGGVAGDDYGLIADPASLDNPSFTASAFPLISNTLKFTLNGFTGSLDQLAKVKFTFGSGPNFVVNGHTDEPPPPAVPEPSSMALLGMGGVLLGAWGWKRRRAN